MTNGRYLALCYIINSKDADFLTTYGVEYYKDYDISKTNGKLVDLDGYAIEYNTILTHYQTYGTIPTAIELATQLGQDSVLAHSGIETTTSPRDYYEKRLLEDYAGRLTALYINAAGKNFATDALKGLKNLLDDLNKVQKMSTPNTTPSTSFKSKREKLKNNFNNMLTNPMSVYSTGLTQLDNILDGGFRSNEELVVIFARTNVGKSWWSLKFALEMWKQGLNVGFFSPEMSEDIVWNRILTLNSHVSNKVLNKPYGTDITNADFDDLLSRLPEKGDLHITDMTYFGDNVTVSALEKWVTDAHLDALFLDGVSYITAEREQDLSSWERPGKITRQLMALSVKLSIPIIIVAQANRSAVTKDKDGTHTNVPTLDTIANSDQIVQHATRVIGIGKGDTTEDNNLYTIGIIKNRYGDNNRDVKFRVEIDTGRFIDESCFKDATSFNAIPVYKHKDFII